MASLDERGMQYTSYSGLTSSLCNRENPTSICRSRHEKEFGQTLMPSSSHRLTDKVRLQKGVQQHDTISTFVCSILIDAIFGFLTVFSLATITDCTVQHTQFIIQETLFPHARNLCICWKDNVKQYKSVEIIQRKNK